MCRWRLHHIRALRLRVLLAQATMRTQKITYLLSLLTALLLAVTCNGVTLEHHCHDCAAAHNGHSHHGCCEQCDHCSHCKVLHFDSVQTDLPQLLTATPAPEQVEALHCIIPIDSTLQAPLHLPEYLHTGTPPQWQKKGRAVLRKIKKLVI